MHQTDVFADSDSSDSSDGSFNINRAEAVRRFPEAAHQALAATLGLIYYKIRNEVGEGPNGPVAPRPPKRQQEEVASTGTDHKSKPVKMARRPSITGTFLHRLISGPSVESKSSTSAEEFDKLGWNPFSDVSEDAMGKLRSIDAQDIGTVLRALEQGHLKLKPSGSEKARMSAAEPKASHAIGKPEPAQEEVPTVPNTVPTQPLSSVASKAKSASAKAASVPDIPETASDADSSTS